MVWTSWEVLETRVDIGEKFENNGRLEKPAE
jgi:hypothetical protein